MIFILEIFILYSIAYLIYWKYFIKPNFKGKTIFLTGASSGIGEELCRKLIALGAEKVIIASRNLSEMKRV